MFANAAVPIFDGVAEIVTRPATLRTASPIANQLFFGNEWLHGSDRIVVGVVERHGGAGCC